ncbi:hypothetical protein LOCUS_54710 [Klebsiella pneumoniae]|nr:hypothetical protein LOCUS_54710 [Klebsiella pneumoniae]
MVSKRQNRRGTDAAGAGPSAAAAGRTGAQAGVSAGGKLRNQKTASGRAGMGPGSYKPLPTHEKLQKLVFRPPP